MKKRRAHDGEEDSGWADRIIQQMSNFLFQYRLELASMFRAFDVNNDGTISRQEFKV
jgi:Ca2+-binding EF-hand superfamily protein